MPSAFPPPLPPLSPTEAIRFQAVAEEVCSSPPLASHIGTLREKELHATLKRFLCPDPSCLECTVGDLLREEDDKPRHMVADILTEGQILEIQTGSLFPLREKLKWYLSHTPCEVTVVHPIAAVKHLSWIHPENGSILSRRRSPKRGRVQDIAGELHWVSELIGDPRFSIRLLLVELEEYRIANGWSKDGKRGSDRYQRIPTALLGDVTLRTPADYALYFLPPALTSPSEGPPLLFTAATFTKATGIRGRATYGTLHTLERLGVIQRSDVRSGRGQTWFAPSRNPLPRFG